MATYKSSWSVLQYFFRFYNVCGWFDYFSTKIKVSQMTEDPVIVCSHSVWLTWGAPCFFKVNIAQMQNTSNHSKQVQLLCVVQTDPLHGHTHPVEVALVVQKRILQSSDLQMLQHTSWSELRLQDKHTMCGDSIQITIYSNNGNPHSLF